MKSNDKVNKYREKCGWKNDMQKKSQETKINFQTSIIIYCILCLILPINKK